MPIMINHSSMVPIYEQIVEQMKQMIIQGELRAEEALPSVRNLAKELKVSALTVKKAYDQLEQEGFTKTIHGKGSYVLEINPQLQRQEQEKEIEADLERIIGKAKNYQLSKEQIVELITLIWEG